MVVSFMIAAPSPWWRLSWAASHPCYEHPGPDPTRPVLSFEDFLPCRRGRRYRRANGGWAASCSVRCSGSSTRPVRRVDQLEDRAAVGAGLLRRCGAEDAADEVIHLLRDARMPQLADGRERPAAGTGRFLAGIPVAGVAVGQQRRAARQVGVGDALASGDLGPVVHAARLSPA